MSPKHRRYGRHEVEGVRGSIAAAEAKVVDISLEGLTIEVGKSLQVGRAYRLSLQHKARPVPIEGVVAWSKLGGTRTNEAGEVEPVYRAGIHIEKILSGKAAELYKFIEENVVIKPGVGLFGRFTVQTQQGAGLVAEFSVKKISLSGMLIEAQFAPELGSLIQIQILLGERTLEPEVCIVRVEHVEREGSYPLTLVAVEFVELAEETRKALAKFIRECLI